jgi:biotin operon repressor
MIVQRQLVFVDAFGDTSLDTEKAGVTSQFIISGVIVDQASVETVRARFEALRQRHFQSGEMRSSKIGPNDERRIKLLTELRDVQGWKFYATAIDKREVSKTSGLVYKRSFVKYLHGNLFRRFFEAYPDVRVVVDGHGSQEFMDSFVAYVKKRHIPALWSSGDVEFADSKDEVMIQTADVIAGSLARVLDDGKRSTEANRISALLRDVSLGIDCWPPSSATLAGSTDDISEDNFVRDQSVRAATFFLEAHHDDEEFESRCRVECVKYLLFQFSHVNATRYVSTESLIQAVGESARGRVGKDFFRLHVIAKLRDAGVIVASSSKGYKIPSSLRDLLDFVEHGRSMIEPMLGRLHLARSKLMLASKGEMDVLADPRYLTLRKLLDVIESDSTM